MQECNCMLLIHLLKKHVPSLMAAEYIVLVTLCMNINHNITLHNITAFNNFNAYTVNRYKRR